MSQLGEKLNLYIVKLAKCVQSYLFVCTMELDDLRFLCGDDEVDAEDETIGDLETIPWLGTTGNKKRACS